MKPAIHSLHSSYRETLLEHLFVGELLRELWLRGPIFAEVMKPQVDDRGYDLVLDCNGVTRHVQLKASFLGSRTSRQSVHVDLARKPSGCVVWMRCDADSLNLGPFLWFGGAPGEPLPSLDGLRVARHAKGDSHGHKAERPSIRVIPRRRFEKVETVGDLLNRLFGPLPEPRS